MNIDTLNVWSDDLILVTHCIFDVIANHWTCVTQLQLKVKHMALVQFLISTCITVMYAYWMLHLIL